MAVKFKGFVISPVHSVGSSIRIDNHGVVHDRRPTKKDIEHYEITDPMENGARLWCEDTISTCKAALNSLLADMNMKDNKPATWKKLEASG